MSHSLAKKIKKKWNKHCAISVTKTVHRFDVIAHRSERDEFVVKMADLSLNSFLSLWLFLNFVVGFFTLTPCASKCLIFFLGYYGNVKFKKKKTTKNTHEQTK